MQRMRLMLLTGMLWVACGFVLPPIPSLGNDQKAGDGAVFTDVSGKPYRLPGPGECEALVVIFVSHDCPIANNYTPEIKRLCRAYRDRGVAFCIVYAERDLAPEAARTHAREYGYCCPAILDPELKLARRLGATKVPEAAVLSPRGELLYRGRIDDRYVDYGKRRPVVTSHDLRDVLDAVLSGKPVACSRTEVIGCDIDFGPGGDR